jgi:hypothetical protein
MDPGFRSPLVDMFRRGEVDRDIRVQAARGALAPRVHEQLALLIILSDDQDVEISTAANLTLDALPVAALQSFLTRADVPQPMRDFFAARGVVAGAASAAGSEGPLGDEDEGQAGEESDDDEPAAATVLSSLGIVERMKLAMKGTKGHRAQLIRDSNKLVAAAVLSSPKLTTSEVEAFAKMGNVSEDVLRAIAMNRQWVKNYGVISALTRNPKTPPAISMQMVQRLHEKDLKMLSMDRNVPEAVRLAARKFMKKGPKDMA